MTKSRCVALLNGKRCRRAAKFEHMNRRGDNALGFEVRHVYMLCAKCSDVSDAIDREINRGVAPPMKGIDS